MLDSLGYGYSDPCSEEYNFVASSRLEYIICIACIKVNLNNIHEKCMQDIKN